MSFRYWVTHSRRSIAALLLCLAASGMAQATFVVGKWDPAFGAPFSDLGWRGSVTAFVPDECNGPGGSGILTPMNCPGLDLTAAEVEFYDLRDPGTATVETLNFEPTTQLAFVIKDDSGDVEGWSTYFTGSVQSTSAIAKYDTGSGLVNPHFVLQLLYQVKGQTLAQLWWSEDDPDDCISRNPAFGFFPGRCLDGRNNPDDLAELNAVVSFQAVSDPVGVVPEPAGLALVGAALGALALAQRRRRATR